MNNKRGKKNWIFFRSWKT